jgi:uncharacterized protein YegP (UPF0339 family)
MTKDLHIKISGSLLYHWVLVARNGEVLATSETYFSRSNAIRAARRLSAAIGVAVAGEEKADVAR